MGEAAGFVDRKGSTSLRTGLGFTLNPDGFLLGLELSHFLGHQVALGPLLQFGVSDDEVLLAPTANLRGVFDLSGDGLEKLKPFVQGGVGLAYLSRDRPFREDDDVGFLFNFGGGFDYLLTEDVSLGSNLLFNIMPADVLGENFFFSWQFVTVTINF